MNGVLLVTALAQALSEGAPERDAVWAALIQAVKDGKLLSRKRRSEGSEEIQAAIRRSISNGTFRPGWLEACESALLQSPAAWLNYIESHGHTLAVAQKLRLILRLHTSKPDLLPAPFATTIVSILEDMLVELDERCGTIASATSLATTPQTPPRPAPQETLGHALTKSQQGAFERLSAMAEIYFQPPISTMLTPRLTPLLVGPTGVGKSAVAKQIAATTGSQLVRVCLSTWTPSGSRELPTLRRLGQTLSKHDRVVLVIDEIDKLATDNGAWTRSCAAEIFDVLERECAHLMAENDADRKSLEHKLRSAVFIVAAGTWQHLHTRRSTTRALGFCAARNVLNSAPPEVTELAISDGFPAELLGRFHSTPIVLDYPDPGETSEILERSGIRALAERTGRLDLLERFSWRPFGARALESLLTDLLLLQQKQQADSAQLSP